MGFKSINYTLFYEKGTLAVIYLGKKQQKWNISNIYPNPRVD